VIERGLLPVIAQYPADSPVDTLHLITVCVDDDSRKTEKWVAANHKVHRAKAPSGASEKIVSVAVPLRPSDVASNAASHLLHLYFQSLYRQLHKQDLKLPAGFSFAPLIAYVQAQVDAESAL